VYQSFIVTADPLIDSVGVAVPEFETEDPERLGDGRSADGSIM
jgi:hypothetical protein